MTIYLEIDPTTGDISRQVSVNGLNQLPPPGLPEAGPGYQSMQVSYFDGANFSDRTKIELDLPPFETIGEIIQLSGLPAGLFLRINGLDTVAVGNFQFMMGDQGMTVRAVGQFVSPNYFIETVSDEGKRTRGHPMMSATNDEVDAWVDANVTDLASARTLFKLLIRAIRRL